MPSVSSVLIHALVVEDNIRFGGLVYKLETVVGVGAPGASRGPGGFYGGGAGGAYRLGLLR